MPEDATILTLNDATLDLAEIARIRRGERVKVEDLPDATQDLFDKTLALVQPLVGADDGDEGAPGLPKERTFVPENKDLRTIYFLAEAVGGYEVLNDLVNVHSPGSAISERISEKAKVTSLGPEEVRVLERYQAQINDALKNANEYLKNSAVYELSREDLYQLHDVILAARKRAKLLNEIMGAHLIHEVERTVERLHEYHTKMRNVDRTVDGIFMVDSELLFIPANELILCVNTVFNAVGNSYLAKNIDGVLLLAARNLLIEVVSFFSYYGKHQIYSLFKRSGSTISTQAITARIRHEIRKLFAACKRDNKLVLTRVMENAERDFELSVGAIQHEAEQIAVEAVKILIPEETVVAKKPKKSLFQKLLGWFGR
ncbi:MAG: hypothetical protein R3174_07445 [Gammaproteobacteria bacterium]|nr:hypothetical protein [Gammaproteobacteria bacterium]